MYMYIVILYYEWIYPASITYGRLSANWYLRLFFFFYYHL